MADFGGRYRRGRLLGAGGMGEVWLAFDEELGDRPVAIKMMHSWMLTEIEDVARFQREMRLASRMQHPNVLTVYTTGTDNGIPYMVMEYLVGRDLSKVPPGLDIGQVIRIGRETGAALAYAHSQGVMHRDIKPGNLFLSDTGLTKVTDFGIAKAVSGTKLSVTGAFVGTLAYMAPEQWLGQPATFSNDVWAVGCVLYGLLSGRLPREFTAPVDYMAAAARRESVVPIAEIAPVPAWLGAAVMAMLSLDPASRPTAEDVVRLLAGPPMQASPAPARPAPAPPSAVPPDYRSDAASRPLGGPATAPSAPRPPTSPVQAPRLAARVPQAARPARPAAPGGPGQRSRRTLRVKVLAPVAGAVVIGVIAALLASPGGGPALAVSRGNIMTADGVTIAATRQTSDQFKYQRSYPAGPTYAPVTGYDTVFTQAQAPNYATGVERAENSYLSGATGDAGNGKGATVQLTIDSKAQEAAYKELQTVLEGRTINGKQVVGGVVALDPSTGKILAMASYPSYDPNEFALHNTAQVNEVAAKLGAESPSPLVDNATQTALSPGATFNIVTSSAWYNQDPARTPNTLVNSPQPLHLPNGDLVNNEDSRQCGDGSGKTPVVNAFAQSCNTPFAIMGIDLGSSAIKSMATAYGLNNPSATEIPGVNAAASNFTPYSDKSLTAFDATGQDDTTATPLEEAMFAATVANKGVLMQPYLIGQVQGSDGSVIQRTPPQQLSRPVSATIADYERQMMIAAVQQPDGMGYPLNKVTEGGLVIAGASGATRSAGSADDAFTAFAPADNPKIAVGVIIQGDTYGSSGTTMIAGAVIKAYLSTLGTQ